VHPASGPEPVYLIECILPWSRMQFSSLIAIWGAAAPSESHWLYLASGPQPVYLTEYNQLHAEVPPPVYLTDCILQRDSSQITSLISFYAAGRQPEWVIDCIPCKVAPPLFLISLLLFLLTFTEYYQTIMSSSSDPYPRYL